MECTFVVGQEVYCTHDFTNSKARNKPVKGCIYRIRSLDSGWTSDLRMSVGLLLQEVVNPLSHMKNGQPCEPLFEYTGFRPVKKLKNENLIEIFNITPTKVTEDA